MLNWSWLEKILIGISATINLDQLEIDFSFFFVYDMSRIFSLNNALSMKHTNTPLTSAVQSSVQHVENFGTMNISAAQKVEITIFLLSRI